MIDFPSEYLKERCKFDFGNKIERMIDTEASIITLKRTCVNSNGRRNHKFLFYYQWRKIINRKILMGNNQCTDKIDCYLPLLVLYFFRAMGRKSCCSFTFG